MRITVMGNQKEVTSFCFSCFKSTNQKLYVRDGFLVLRCCKCKEKLLMEMN